jgi:hypothetical protein
MAPQRPRSCRPILVGLVAACLAVSIAPQARASTIVYLDAPSSEITALSPQVTARVRFSRAGSVDQMLYKQPNPAGYPAVDTVGFTDGSFVGRVTYDFTVQHFAGGPGVGSRMEFSLNNGVTAGAVAFRPVGAGNGANSTVSRLFDAPDSPTGLNYNIIHVYGQTTTVGSSLWFSNLAFTPGPGLTTSGQLATSGSLAYSASGPNSYDQWLAAETGTNLDLYDWAISGRVSLAVNGTNPSSGEGIKFEITGKQGLYPDPIAVPEPGTLALLASVAVAGLVVGGRRRLSGCSRRCRS